MKIAFVVSRFPALSETFVLHQITGLIERGHEVHIYADRAGAGPVHADAERLSERTHYSSRLPGNVLRRVLSGARLTGSHILSAPRQVAGALNFFRHGRLASSFKLLHAAVPCLPSRPVYNVIHAHFGPNGIKALALREIGALGGKLITTFHGYDVNVRARSRGENLYSKLFARGELFTANTRFTASQLEALGCPRAKIELLPVGVNTRRFQRAEVVHSPGEPVRLLTVARLIEPKGIEFAIRALALLEAGTVRLHYTVVGTGPLQEKLEALCRELRVADLVTFAGPQTQEEVLRAYANSDLFVLPSVVGRDGTEETQGLVLLEAQAMELPVIASQIGGIPESLRDGASGFLVPPGDPAALAARLKQLINARESWASMGKAGREFVRANFEQTELNDRLVSIYERVRSMGSRGLESGEQAC